ncbi:MAG: glycosyltransferase family 4 protein [Alphaproteobacteria bacterium]
MAVRIELTDGRTIERSWAFGEPLLRLPSATRRVFLVLAGRADPVEPAGGLIPIGALTAWWILVRFWIVARRARPGGLVAAMRTASRLLARGRWEEIRRRLGRPGSLDFEGGGETIESSRRIAALAPRAEAGPTRILAYGVDFRLEGAPISFCELVRGLVAREGVAARALAPSNGPLQSWYGAIPARVLDGLYLPPLDGVEHARNVERISTEIRAWPADVVLANTLRAFPAVEAAAQLGVPALWIIRESEPWPGVLGDLPPDILRRAHAAFGQAWGIVFVSEATRTVWRQHLAGLNTHVIANGIDLSRFAGASAMRTEARRAVGLGDDECAILCVGTISARKGQGDLVDALAMMSEGQSASCRIFLAGMEDPPYAAKLYAAIARLPKVRRERIAILPVAADPRGLYAAADIYVCCSRYESYPRTVLEALYCGLPIISTPVFGIREQVEEGKSALFYAPGDGSALCAHLASLVNDGARRASLAMEARKRASTLPGYDALIAS